MNVSGVVANASVNVSQDSDEGEVSFNITAFDLAGNSFTVDQTQLNSSNVTIDSSIPGVQTLSVTSNNTDPEFAMAGDTITVTLQVSEQIENSTLQILNDSITMIVNNDTASATVTVLENSTNGPVEFNITAYDETGNVFNVTSENITENNVVIDTINPSLANLTIYSNNATTPLTFITYVESKIVMFAALRVSFAVIVMFRMLFTVARDVLALLLYMVRFARDGLIVSITTLFSVIFSDVTLNTFPVSSYAVMLNSTGPFVEFSKTVTVALAVSLFTIMVMLSFRICRVEFSICSDTCKVTVIVSPAIANSGSVLLLVTLRVCTPGMLLSIVTFDEFNCVWSTVKLFPARSKAVMLNDTSPSSLS